MQSTSKRPLDVDPEYELTDSSIKRIKLKEQQEKQETAQKVTNILTNHFNTELNSRQSQIETIQERIVKVQKTIHLLRYVLVRSYYYNRSCVVNTDVVQEPSTSTADVVIDPQSRIHPAVKRLIGKNGSFHFRNRRRLQQPPTVKSEECSESETKDDSDRCERVAEATLPTVVRVNNNNCDGVRNRKKRKYRVIVGNISKYAPAKEKDDSSTHKWMIYVRGPRDEPKVSHFIRKVVFYLHPSYAPSDVIELDKDPFHLSRRGWGEFPVRVQIFFQCTLNKPVDIIHNLKLDKTHTGRQTLGNETIVDLSLYENNTGTKTGVKDELTLEQEEVIIKSEAETTNNHEHDYYNNTSDNEVDVDEKTECIQLDHTYCLPHSSEGANFKVNGNVTFNTSFNTTMKELIPQLLSKETNVKVLKIMDKDGKAVIFSSLKSSIDYNEYKINIPIEKFKCVLEVLPFLFRRLPLVTNLADTLNYRCRYPYVARTLNEYCSWNIGRRRSSEWRRAKTVLEYLQSTKIFDHGKWTTKHVIMYARSHAYTPTTTTTSLVNDISCKILLTEYKLKTAFTKPALLPEPNVAVNVTDDDDMDEDVPEFKHGKNTFLGKNCNLECSFIRKVVANSRVKLQPEEIAPGVLCNAAEIMIWESLKCFVNDLVRNARTHLVLRGKFCDKSDVIATQDVSAAIHDRREFKNVFDSINHKKTMEYYM